MDGTKDDKDDKKADEVDGLRWPNNVVLNKVMVSWSILVRSNFRL